MNIKYYSGLKFLKSKYKETTRELLQCLAQLKDIAYRQSVTLEDIFINHDLSHILKQIEKYCINKEEYKEYDHKNFEDTLFDFFIFDIKCPDSIKDCDGLRAEYMSRLENLRISKDCNECSENMLKLYFIKNILEKNYIKNIKTV